MSISIPDTTLVDIKVRYHWSPLLLPRLFGVVLDLVQMANLRSQIYSSSSHGIVDFHSRQNSNNLSSLGQNEVTDLISPSFSSLNFNFGSDHTDLPSEAEEFDHCLPSSLETSSDSDLSDPPSDFDDVNLDLPTISTSTSSTSHEKPSAMKILSSKRSASQLDPEDDHLSNDEKHDDSRGWLRDLSAKRLKQWKSLAPFKRLPKEVSNSIFTCRAFTAP